MFPSDADTTGSGTTVTEFYVWSSFQIFLATHYINTSGEIFKWTTAQLSGRPTELELLLWGSGRVFFKHPQG